MSDESVIKRFSGAYWKSQINLALERRKTFITAAEESIRVYNAQKDIGIMRDTERRLNVWWYCVNTLLPAYYSSTPKAEVTLRKRSGGTLHEASAVILERNIQYQMDMEFNFDQVGYTAALQFLLTGQAVLWARYAFESEVQKQEMVLFQNPDGTLVDSDNETYEGPTDILVAGPGNTLIVPMDVEVKEDERAILETVQYNDYICSDARNESEVEWRGRRAYLTREQAVNLFGEDVGNKLKFDSFPEAIKKDFNRDREKYEGKAEVYEIWCYESGQVYWIQMTGEKSLLMESEPPIEFEKFYPCVVIAQSQDPDSVIPVSDYSHVKDQILEIERMTTRIHAVTQAIRTNATYDSAIGSQIEQLMIGDLKMVPTINWPSYKARGGLQNSIEFMPIAPFVEALGTLQAARQTALTQLYETLKVSDLLRGTSAEYKTATANRLENAWSSLGLIVRQNMFTKFISDGIGNLGVIVTTMFEKNKIMNVADAPQVLLPLVPATPPPPPLDPNIPPEMQPLSPPPIDPAMMVSAMEEQIMALYRDDDQFNYRIQIASDSMVAIDQAQDQAEGAQLMSTCGEFFNQMKALIEQYPPLLEFSIQLFQNVIKRFKGGKELDGIFTKALKQVGEISAAREEAAKQPPPPDPKTIEIQGRMQIAQIEAQARLQAAQMEMTDAHDKNIISYQESQLKMQREQVDAQLKIQAQQFNEYVKQQELGLGQQELQIKSNAVQVDMLKVQAMSASDANKQAIQQETNRMSQILEIQKLELDNMRVRLAESEKLMEERRLNNEQELERVRMAMQTMQVPAKSESQPVVINNIIPKPSKRVGKVIMDELGNPSIELNNIDDEG